jgi:hypothetical protein
MSRLESRLDKLEKAAGIGADAGCLSRLSDAQLDEEMVRCYAVLSANLSQGELEKIEEEALAQLGLGPEPVLEASRKFWPMTTDINALALKRAGRTFYDECAGLSLEQIEGRVNAHVARFTGASNTRGRAATPKEVGHGQKH